MDELSTALKGVATGIGRSLRKAQTLEFLIEQGTLTGTVKVVTKSGTVYSVTRRDGTFLWVNEKSGRLFESPVWVEPMGSYLSFRDEEGQEVGWTSTIYKIETPEGVRYERHPA